MAFEETSWWDLTALTDRRISREELRAFLEPIVAETGGTFEVKGASSMTIARILAPERKGSISVLWDDCRIHPYKSADLLALCNGHPETDIGFAIWDEDERGDVITESECVDLERMIVRLAGRLAEHFDKSLFFYDQSDAIYSADEMIQLAREGKQRDESWAYKLARAKQLRQDQIVREGFAEMNIPYEPPAPLRSTSREERRKPKPPPINFVLATPEERAQAVERARQLVEQIVFDEVIADPVAGSVLVGPAAVVVVPGEGVCRPEWALWMRFSKSHDASHVVIFGERMSDQQVEELREDPFIPAHTQTELYDFLLTISSLHNRYVKPNEAMRSKVLALAAPPISRVRYWDGKAYEGIILRLDERRAMLNIAGGEYQLFDIQRDLSEVILPERASMSVNRDGKVLILETAGNGRS
ncbi:MAG TPA: hypothetical protein VGZ00_04715 [Candidatus Baltobacteraceae bacterium]|jgi:hypothetical protein|nr:hypothetical protein [Candidatus Baltobacteraceae bacterium]